MFLKDYTPLPALQPFISRLFIVRYILDNRQPRPVNPFPPQPDHCLYFYPYDKIRCHNYADNSVQQTPAAMLVGPQLTRVDLTMGYNMLTIIVFFRTGGLYRLLGVPMYELIDRSYDASLFLGNEINELTQQLSATTDYNFMISIIQQYLLKKVRLLKKELPIETVLAQAIKSNEPIIIDRLAEQANVSTRQLERQFKERIGIPPKLFCRLVRFSKAWNMRERNPAISWLHIAHSCNYADQMHMIRDFKEFAGVTPGLLQHDLAKTPLRLQADAIAY